MRLPKWSESGMKSTAAIKSASGGIFDPGGWFKGTIFDSDAFNVMWKLSRNAFDSLAAALGVDMAQLRGSLSKEGLNPEEFIARLEEELAKRGIEPGDDVPPETLAESSDAAAKESQSIPQNQAIIMVVCGLAALYIFGGKL